MLPKFDIGIFSVFANSVVVSLIVHKILLLGRNIG